MPPTGSCSCGDLHSGLTTVGDLDSFGWIRNVECSSLSGFEPLSGWGPDFAKLAKSFGALPLQVDLTQHSWHWLHLVHKTIE